MAYKPKNLANFRDDSSDYPKGSSTGKGGGVVPGTSGSNDRSSQPPGIGSGDKYDNFGYGTDANMQPGGKDFSLADGGMNNRLDPRKNEGFGKRTYSADKPTL